MRKVSNPRERVITMKATHNGLPLYRTKKKNKGFDTRILDKLRAWLDFVIDKYSKSYYVRLDFTFPDKEEIDIGDSEANILFLDFLDVFRRGYTLKRIRTDYFWVREQSSTGNPHYHLVFVIDGNIFQSSEKVFERAKKVWARKLGLVSGAGYVNRSNLKVRKIIRQYTWQESSNPYFYETLHQALSYLAKVYSKDTPKGLNEYGNSRITKPFDLFPEFSKNATTPDDSDDWPIF